MVEVTQLDMLRLGCNAEAIVCHLYLIDVVGIFFAKGSCRPVACVEVSTLGRPAVYVPGQVHAELQFFLSRLDVAHINYPLVAHALVIGFA